MTLNNAASHACGRRELGVDQLDKRGNLERLAQIALEAVLEQCLAL